MIFISTPSVSFIGYHCVIRSLVAVQVVRCELQYNRISSTIIDVGPYAAA